MNLIAYYSTGFCHEKLILELPCDLPLHEVWREAKKQENRFCSAQLVKIELVKELNLLGPR